MKPILLAYYLGYLVQTSPLIGEPFPNIMCSDTAREPPLLPEGVRMTQIVCAPPASQKETAFSSAHHARVRAHP